MWAELPEELLGMVLEKLQEVPLVGGIEGSKHVRLVSREWRASHDALVTRLRLSPKTTDEGMWLLVRRFPAVESVAMKYCGCSDEGFRAVSTCTALTSINLSYCTLVTDEGLRAVSTCTALTSINLSYCTLVTDEGLRAVSTCTVLTSLNLSCSNVTNEGLLAVSRLTGLTSLNLHLCRKITDEGVEALRREASASDLHIRRL
jgi:hypothetical protein